MKKMEIDSLPPPPQKKKDEHPLTKKQNRTKTKQVKAAAARGPDLTLS